jgi:hypothetical protein
VEARVQREPGHRRVGQGVVAAFGGDVLTPLQPVEAEPHHLQGHPGGLGVGLRQGPGARLLLGLVTLGQAVGVHHQVEGLRVLVHQRLELVPQGHQPFGALPHDGLHDLVLAHREPTDHEQQRRTEAAIERGHGAAAGGGRPGRRLLDEARHGQVRQLGCLGPGL